MKKRQMRCFFAYVVCITVMLHHGQVGIVFDKVTPPPPPGDNATTRCIIIIISRAATDREWCLVELAKSLRNWFVWLVSQSQSPDMTRSASTCLEQNHSQRTAINLVQW